MAVLLGDQLLVFWTICSATYSRVFLYPRTYYCVGWPCLASALLEPAPPTWVTIVRLVAAATPFIPPRLPHRLRLLFELLAVSSGLTVAVIPIFEHTTDAAWLVTLPYLGGATQRRCVATNARARRAAVCNIACSVTPTSESSRP